MLKNYPALLAVAVVGTAIGVFLFLDGEPYSMDRGGLNYMFAAGLAILGTILLLVAAPFNRMRQQFARVLFAIFFCLGCLAFLGVLFFLLPLFLRG